jgi:hypothetical protein
MSGYLPFAPCEWRVSHLARSERSLAMFPRLLSIAAGVMTVICVAALPSQANAQHRRGMVRPGFSPQVTRFGPGFDRRFMDPRMNGMGFGFDQLRMNPALETISPTFDRRFMLPTSVLGMDRRIVTPGFGGFVPGFDRRFMSPLLLGF